MAAVQKEKTFISIIVHINMIWTIEVIDETRCRCRRSKCGNWRDVDLSQPVAEREPDVKLMDKGVGKPDGY